MYTTFLYIYFHVHNFPVHKLPFAHVTSCQKISIVHKFPCTHISCPHISYQRFSIKRVHTFPVHKMYLSQISCTQISITQNVCTQISSTQITDTNCRVHKFPVHSLPKILRRVATVSHPGLSSPSAVARVDSWWNGTM